MTVTSDHPGMADCYAEFSEHEVNALRAVIGDADGRKSATKTARKVNLNREGESYYAELSNAELDALRSVVCDADGRKAETRVAREALGIYN